MIMTKWPKNPTKSTIVIKHPYQNYRIHGYNVKPWGIGLEYNLSIRALSYIRGDKTEQSAGWDRKNQGPVFKHVWHDKDPFLLNDHMRQANTFTCPTHSFKIKCGFFFFWYYVLLTHTNPVHVLIKGNDSTYMYQWSFEL